MTVKYILGDAQSVTVKRFQVIFEKLFIQAFVADIVWWILG